MGIDVTLNLDSGRIECNDCKALRAEVEKLRAEVERLTKEAQSTRRTGLEEAAGIVESRCKRMCFATGEVAAAIRAAKEGE